MKTVRLAAMTAIISSVVGVDNAVAADLPPLSPLDEPLERRLEADDPELAEALKEFDMPVDEPDVRPSPSPARMAPTPTPSPKRIAPRKTLGGTRPLSKKRR